MFLHCLVDGHLIIDSVSYELLDLPVHLVKQVGHLNLDRSPKRTPVVLTKTDPLWMRKCAGIGVAGLSEVPEVVSSVGDG